MLIYNVIQFYKDYEDINHDDFDSFINVFSFAAISQADAFAKQARKTQKEDKVKYRIEVSNLDTVDEAMDFLNKVYGREDGI